MKVKLIIVWFDHNGAILALMRETQHNKTGFSTITYSHAVYNCNIWIAIVHL